MEQGIGNTENTQQPPLISNIDVVSNNTGYILTRNNNKEVAVEEQPEPIQNLNNGNRYHLTRNNGNLQTTQDQSIQIPTPTSTNLIYAVRGNGNAYTLTRTPAIMEYVFATNSLQNNASFEVLGERGSRCVHVCNASGKLVKIGLLHVTTFRSVGLIDRNYSFEIILNNINQQFFNFTIADSVGNNDGRSRTMVIEHLNLFVNQGDCIGLRYVQGRNGRTGDYCEVRIMVDCNARQNNFGGAEIV